MHKQMKAFPSTNDAEHECWDILWILDDGYQFVGEVADEEDAQFIVKAVNHHDELVKMVEELCMSRGLPHHEIVEIEERAKALLEKVKS